MVAPPPAPPALVQSDRPRLLGHAASEVSISRGATKERTQPAAPAPAMTEAEARAAWRAALGFDLPQARPEPPHP